MARWGILRSIRARVHSRAKLAYNSVAAWLDGTGPMPQGDRRRRGARREPAPAGPGGPDHAAAAGTCTGRLSLETVEAQPVFEGDLLSGIETEEKNRAKTIIEDFMIAANGVAARFLSAKGSPSHTPGGAHAQSGGTASSR